MKTSLAAQRLIALLATAIIAFTTAITKCAAQDPLNNGLVAYWPFDYANGSVLTPDVAGGRDMLPYFGGANVLTNFNANTISFVSGFRSNAVSMDRNRTAAVGYFSSGAADLLPMLRLTNFTLSFWVKSDPAANIVGRRLFAVGSTTANTIWDIAYEDGSISVPAVLDHFPRQALVGGQPFAELNGQHYKGTANAIALDDTWHNITIVSKTVTNLNAPVISSTTYEPFTPSATIVWNSEALDSIAQNVTNQVNVNQNYLVQKADVASGPWTTIAQVGSGGGAPLGTQQYVDVNATNPMAFYRVIKPGVRHLDQIVYVDRTNICLVGADNFSSLLPGVPQVNGAVYRVNGNYNANTMAFGTLMRGASTAWATCLIDDAAVWNRALSDAEIALYIQFGVTNPPQPNLLVTLSATFPTVVTGDSLGLAWTASPVPDTMTLNPGAMNVKPQSPFGPGNTNLIVLAPTTFQLEATRAANSATGSVSINVVSNVASGWHYLDSYTFLPNGNVVGQGDWENPAGGAATQNMQPLQVHTAGDGNKVASFNGFDTVALTGNGGVAGRKLQTYSSFLGQSNSFFFRFYIDSSITNIDQTTALYPDVDIFVGMSDKGILDQAFLGGNNGPCIRIFRNSAGSGIGPIDLQAQNGPAAMGLTPVTYSYVTDAVNGDTNGLALDKVYSVWIDVQNKDSLVAGGIGSGGVQSGGDQYVVYLQREDWPGRTNLFSDIVNTNIDGSLNFGATLISPRDMSTLDNAFPLSDTLDNMFLCLAVGTTPQGTNTVRFDDFYITTGNTNSTAPVAAGSFVAP